MSAQRYRLQPPPGWRIELLGIINTVEFSAPGLRLFWCDGEWWIGLRSATRSAPGVPKAQTMGEARSVGCSWLSSLDRQQLPEAAL